MNMTSSRREFLAGAAALFALKGFPGATSPSFREKVEAEMRRQIAAGYCTCIACGAVGGERFVMGNRRPGEAKPVPVQTDSLFEVASVSKLMTGTIAARLWCEGKIDVDAPVGEYLKGFKLGPGAEKITVRDIATHSGGYTDGWMGDAGIYNHKIPYPFKTFESFREALIAAKPVYPRGEKYIYACHNFIMLGFIVEQVLGVDLDAAARKYVWGPLGMKSTTWHNCPDDPRTVRMYTHGPIGLGYKGDEKAAAFPHPVGNAGVFTSLDDMLLFVDDLINRRKFEPKCYDLLSTPTFDHGNLRRSFGFNMCLGDLPKNFSKKTIWHTGYTGQHVAIDTEKKVGGVVLTNLMLDRRGRGAAYDARWDLLSMLAFPG